MYILSVNPNVLSSAFPSNSTINYQGALFLGVALSTFIATFLMGMYAKLPIVLAPGLGLNAFFAFTVAGQFGLGFSGALIAVFFSGIVYFFVAITPLRKYIIQAFPKNFRIAISILIGLFITYIGLVNTGLIVSREVGPPTNIGDLTNPLVIIGLITLFIIVFLYFLNIPGAILIGILLGFLMLLITFLVTKNQNYSEAELTKTQYLNYFVGLRNNFKIQPYGDLKEIGPLLEGSWSGIGKYFANPLFYVSIFTFFYIDFFDTSGTLILVSNLLEKDQIKTEELFKKGNIVDATGTVCGAILGSSTVTSYIESSVGIKSGARTGFTTIIIAALFLLSIAIYPIFGPFFQVKSNNLPSLQPITGPVLILIGILIMSELAHFDWKTKIDLPVLVMTVLFGVLGFSISTGIAFGSIFYILMHKIVYPIIYVLRKQDRSETKVVDHQKLSKKELALRFLKYELNYPILVLGAVSVAYLVIFSLIEAKIL
ncbi:Xanthine/uracil/thiamine/ascorbate permease family protein [[Mycoplasma] cavipharyngis]